MEQPWSRAHAVAAVGEGIVGIAVAHALLDEGHEVVLIDTTAEGSDVRLTSG